MSKPIVITLSVQTKKLFDLLKPTQDQIDSLCVFSDNNNGKSPQGTVEDFTSTVFINNNVKWVGASDDKGFTVAIDSITFKPNSGVVNFFKSTTLNGNGGTSGNVNANVKNDESLIGKHSDYLIVFSVFESPSNVKSFSIDPKLLANE